MDTFCELLRDYVVPRNLWPTLCDVEFPVIDIGRYRADGARGPAVSDCQRLAVELERVGLAVLLDDEFDHMAGEAFSAEAENYFAQPEEVKQADEVANHQDGWTPSGCERARDHSAWVSAHCASEGLPFTQHLPRQEDGMLLRDPKERIFLKPEAGELPHPSRTRYPAFNRPRQTMAGMRQLEARGGKIMECFLSAGRIAAEMFAIGVGEPKDRITRLMKSAPHLLAPTGFNISRAIEALGDVERIWGLVTTLLHYDFNGPFTLHYRSNCPGLVAYTRDGIPFLVRVPPRCLLLQVGRPVRTWTCGAVVEGMHEVVVVPQAQPFIDQRHREGRPAIRTGATFFLHCASDEMLAPWQRFRVRASTTALQRLYPTMTFGDFMAEELKLLGLDV